MLHRTLSEKVACANVPHVKTINRRAHKACRFDSETIASKDMIFGLEIESNELLRDPA